MVRGVSFPAQCFCVSSHNPSDKALKNWSPGSVHLPRFMRRRISYILPPHPRFITHSPHLGERKLKHKQVCMATLLTHYDYNRDLDRDTKLHHLISRPNIISVNYLLNVPNVLDIAASLFSSLNVTLVEKEAFFNAIIDCELKINWKVL